MMLAVRHRVLRLHRDAFGPLHLGDLPQGSWRELDEREARAVEALCGREA